MISPKSVTPSPLSMIVAVLRTAIDGLAFICVTVGSPSTSVVLGSSLVAVTSSEFSGLLAVTVTTLDINPDSSAA